MQLLSDPTAWVALLNLRLRKLLDRLRDSSS
jgi:hypothetical protein